MLEKVKEQFQQLYQQEGVLPQALEEMYEVLSCIKYTDHKQVYLLLHKETGKKAVLKCGSGLHRRIMKEERERLLQMKGDGFPKAFAWEEQKEKSFLVREYIEGDTLQELMDREVPLTRIEALDAALQVCRLLGRLHGQNPPVIYRDVKPQNVVRTPLGECVLIDLDTARNYKSGIEEDTVFMGTRGLASPEQFGYQQTDARTDVYGLGMLMLFLLTGGYAKDKNYEALPARIKKMLEKCTEFNPKDRYSSMKEAERALQGIIAKEKQQRCPQKKKIGRSILMTILLCTITGGSVCYAFAAQQKKNSIEFANPVIERAVREMLRKTDGSYITKEDLNSIYTLVICGERVFSSWVEKEEYMAFNWFVTDNWTQPEESFDMSDLSMFTSLDTLVIQYQNVTELPDLSHLPLVRVDFSNNSMKDISGLAGCTRIKTLYLNSNPISDITVLQGFHQLEELNLARTEVKDLSAVVSDKIKALYMEFTNVEDFSVLKEFPSIENLRVSNATKEEIAYLLQIENLKDLSLYESEVDSLLMFKQCPGLNGLELADCSALTGFEGIEYLPELTFLGLAGTGIQSFPEHFYHDKLQVLEITGTGIKDFKSLLRCSRLRNLYVSETVESKASMQLEGSEIEVQGIK